MKIRCPSCGSQYRVASTSFGKKTKCSKCDQAFRIPKPAPQARRVEIKSGALGPSVSYDCEHCGQPLLSSCSTIGALNSCPGCEAEQTVPGAKQFERYVQAESQSNTSDKVQQLREAEKAVARLRAELAPVTTEEFLKVNGFLPIVPPISRRSENENFNLRFLPSIPQGYCIYETDLEITDLWFHQHAVHQFITATEHGICLVPEPNNSENRNSIAAYGVMPSTSRGKPLTVQIGYLPRDIAGRIVRAELESVIIPRLRNVWSGGKRSTAVGIDLLGPRDVKARFIANG